MVSLMLAALKRGRTMISLARSVSIKAHGRDLHIGAGSRFWAPQEITLGSSVYIGKSVTVECNAEIGSYVLIANHVALLGRHDHDFRAIGVPVRFSPWVGAKSVPSPFRGEKVVIEDDVWLGYGAVVLTGVRVRRGAIVAAGSVVSKDIPAYAIVAGNPAREVGRRFGSDAEIANHEQGIREGRFEFSERGYEHWIVKPGASLAQAGAE